MTALGFIETKGLLAAIEGADAMLKAADVVLLEKNLAGGGLVTISVAGGVAAVKASVDAGVAAIHRIPGSILVSSHVIARPDAELERILAVRVPVSSSFGDGDVDAVPQGTALQPEPGNAAEEGAATGEEGDSEERASAPESGEESVSGLSEAGGPTGNPRYETAQLKRMNVSKLRQLARTFRGYPMVREEIELARKKELIEAFIHAYSREEE